MPSDVLPWEDLGDNQRDHHADNMAACLDCHAGRQCTRCRPTHWAQGSWTTSAEVMDYSDTSTEDFFIPLFCRACRKWICSFIIHVLTPGAKIDISWRWTLPCDQLTGDSLNFARQFNASSRPTPISLTTVFLLLVCLKGGLLLFFSYQMHFILLLLLFPNLFYQLAKSCLN